MMTLGKHGLETSARQNVRYLTIANLYSKVKWDLTPGDPSDILNYMGINLENVDPKPGTVKMGYLAGRQAIYRKQYNMTWAVKDSKDDTFEIDLTERKESGTLEDMSPKEDTTNSLVPLADKYLDHGFNIMLIGLHGTGKTESLQQLAKSRGLKMKYYSCSTLDPFTDLVGVPLPRVQCAEHGDFETRLEHKQMHPECSQQLTENLKMIRPRDIDEAEFIFFDEFNRADAKTLNAIFEIIQFRSINGEPLPNLKACWAAMNPPNENYQVEQLDPALLDRFDLYVDVQAKPSVSYMSKYMHEVTAKALKTWWDEHERQIRAGKKDQNVDYISPRRLMKLGLIWEATSNVRSIHQALPQGGDYDRNKLVEQLKAAQRHILAEQNGTEFPEDKMTEAGVGDGAAPQFIYEYQNLRVKQAEVVTFLKDNPMAHETHKKVANAFKQGIGGEEMIKRDMPLLNALNPALLEGLLNGYHSVKLNSMRAAFKQEVLEGKITVGTYPVLHKVLASGAKADFPR